MSKMPKILVAVNTSLKMMKEAIKIIIYTRAVVSGMIYPKSFLEIK